MLWRINNQMWSLWFWWQNVMWIICSRRWEGKSKQTFKWEKWATTEMLCSEYEIYSRWNYYYILSWNSRCSTGEWFYFYCTFHKDISQCGKFEWLLGVHYRVCQTEFGASTNTDKWSNVFRGGGVLQIYVLKCIPGVVVLQIYVLKVIQRLYEVRV